MHREEIYISKSGKSKIKNFSQYFTPYIIAESMIEWVLEINPKKLLDPAVGNGVFFREIPSSFTKIGHEIDHEIIDEFKDQNNINYSVVFEDYLISNWNNEFDGIVCNPPYNRFQAIKNKDEIRLKFKNHLPIKISGYTNQYALFLMKSIYQLKTNGRLAYIIPAEFLNSGYGTVIKKFLIESQVLHSIIYFSEKTRVFSEAITTTCILLCEKSPKKEVFLKKIDGFDELEKESYKLNRIITSGNKIKYTDLDPSDKWLNHFNSDKFYKYDTVKFKKFAQAKRGIATGANDFFVFNKSKIKKFKLEEDQFIKCITKSNDINSLFFMEEDFDKISNDEKNVYLFDGEKAKSSGGIDYIRYGEKLGFNLRYLTKNRNPWFKIENKKAAPIIINVFSRGKLKVIRNIYGCVNLTAFHGIFINENKKGYTDILFLYLLTPIAQELLYRNKRLYGDGLDKFEPNDINNAEIIDFDIIPQKKISQLTDLYEELKKGYNDTYLTDLIVFKANIIFMEFLNIT